MRCVNNPAGLVSNLRAYNTLIEALYIAFQNCVPWIAIFWRCPCFSLKIWPMDALSGWSRYCFAEAQNSDVG